MHTLSELIKTPRKSVIARSEKQSEYIKALRENNIVIALGPAGTGKSYLAVSVGITLLMEKKVEKVILSRPAVEAGERLGFLPGDMKEKSIPILDHYMMHYMIYLDMRRYKKKLILEKLKLRL